MSQPFHSSCLFPMRMLLFMFVLPFLAAAQPRLELLSASGAAGDPWGSLSFEADCTPWDRFHVFPQDLTLWENGREIKNFDIVQCSGDLRQRVGVALVLDGSANMDSVENYWAKQTAHFFVDLMDGVVDEATITLFNDHPVTYQQMTSVKPMLHSAIDALGANGGSALYDALYLSVIEVAFNTQNPGRALILMTDSRNDSSYRRLDEVLDAAKRYRIPIHVIRMGDQSDSTELRMIASETGGLYFPVSPNGGQLAALYTEIATPKGEQGCLLQYYRRCYAGGDAEVILEWRAPCGGTVVDTITYTAAYDSSTVEPLHLALTADTALADRHMRLTLQVVEPVEGRMRGPIAFTLRYDTTLLSFPYLSMYGNCLLAYEDIRIEPVAGGVRVTAGSALPEREWKEGETPLLRMIFRAHAPAGRGDTIPYVIAVTDVAFVEGCPDLTIDGTSGVILAHGPVLDYDGDHPWEVFRDTRTGAWSPSEFLIEVRLYNSGDRVAQYISGRLDIDTTKLFFISPLSGEYYHPGGVLAANDHVEIVWKVGVRADIVPPDSATSCMTMYAANGWTGTCCCKVFFRDAPLSAGEPPAAASPTLTVWPNPASGRVSVAIPDASRADGVLSVFDALGRMKMVRNVPNGRHHEVLDLSGLPRGLYMVRYSAGRETWMARCLLDR